MKYVTLHRMQDVGISVLSIYVLFSTGNRCSNNASSCKINICPRGSSCATFADIFGNASNFCETVIDTSIDNELSNANEFSYIHICLNMFCDTEFFVFIKS